MTFLCSTCTLLSVNHLMTEATSLSRLSAVFVEPDLVVGLVHIAFSLMAVSNKAWKIASQGFPVLCSSRLSITESREKTVRTEDRPSCLSLTFSLPSCLQTALRVIMREMMRHRMRSRQGCGGVATRDASVTIGHDTADCLYTVVCPSAHKFRLFRSSMNA